MFLDAVTKIGELGAQIQNGGGMMVAMLWLIMKVSSMEKMVTRHNEVLFPPASFIHQHHRKEDQE